jgi:hypothetical protein
MSPLSPLLLLKGTRTRDAGLERGNRKKRIIPSLSISTSLKRPRRRHRSSLNWRLARLMKARTIACGKMRSRCRRVRRRKLTSLPNASPRPRPERKRKKRSSSRSMLALSARIVVVVVVGVVEIEATGEEVVLAEDAAEMVADEEEEAAPTVLPSST